ncbi:MAG: FAD-binding protein [Gammaproteobacteria bacterium]|nr:FAD-binding protein [Gammaproteobacteria bacterium]
MTEQTQCDVLIIDVEDTVNVGAGLCDRDIVKFIVSQGPARINWLLEQGVPFTRETDIDKNHENGKPVILRTGKIRTFCFGNDFRKSAGNSRNTEVRLKSNINPFTVYITSPAK